VTFASVQRAVSFAHVVKGSHRTAKGACHHAMLMESYFDDSSDQKREKFYACGGLMGISSQWDVFDMGWSDGTHGLERPFRSSDCEGGQGQFKDWPKPKRDELMRDLVDIIYETKLHGYVSVVPVAEYCDAFPGCGEHAPFLLALTQAIMNMAFIAETLKDDVKLWFEHGSTDAATLRVYNSIREFREWAPTRRLRGISFDGKELRPLQGADLIAREGFKHVDNLGIRPVRKPVKTLTGRIYFVLWTKESLHFLAENGGPENLNLLSSWDKRTDAPRLISGVLKPK
jgi:hypothetical protein